MEKVQTWGVGVGKIREIKRRDDSKGGERNTLERVKNGYDEEEEEEEQQRRSEEVWVEVLEDMPSASQRRQGDECLLLFQLPDNYRKTWSKCHLTRKCRFCKREFACIFKCLCFHVWICLCICLCVHVRMYWVSVFVLMWVFEIMSLCVGACANLQQKNRKEFHPTHQI